MKKIVISLSICCTCAIICVIAIIYFHGFYPPTINKIQIASFWVDLLIGVATVISTIGAFFIAIRSPYWIQNANKTEIDLSINNSFPYRNKTEVKEINIAINNELLPNGDGTYELYEKRTTRDYYYPTFFYSPKFEF